MCGVPRRYVLKESDEGSIKLEVAAREAVGWNRHGEYLLKVSSPPFRSLGTSPAVRFTRSTSAVPIHASQVIGHEGPSMILETAEVTLRWRLSTSTMELSQASTCISHVLKGLEELHKYNVVHLDIKPENIFGVKDMRTTDTVAHCSLNRSHVLP